MIRFPLNDETDIEVPSLGFGKKWRKARRLLATLTRIRRLGFAPATPWERFLAGASLWRGPEKRLRQENHHWQALFTECQRRLGYSYRECRALLDGPVTYAHRHEYEQILLHGIAPKDHLGLKKNSAPARKPAVNATSSRKLSNTSACSTTATSPKGKSPRPPSTFSKTKPNPACKRSLPFWIRRSR